MLYAEELSDFLLELLNQWPVIRKPTPVEHVVDPADQRAAVPHVGAADMELFRGQFHLQIRISIRRATLLSTSEIL